MCRGHEAMNSVPITMIFGIMLVVLLFATGCIEQPAYGNVTAAPDTATVSSSTAILQPVQTQCPLSGNTTPWIIINPISNHYIGDVFEINGTTNLGIDEKVLVYVTGRVLSVPYPGVAGTTYGTNGTARIWCGNSGINFWNFSVNSSRFNTNFYFVQVETRNISATNFSRFEMKMHSPS
jgi:hypothetical protein